VHRTSSLFAAQDHTHLFTSPILSSSLQPVNMAVTLQAREPEYPIVPRDSAQVAPEAVEALTTGEFRSRQPGDVGKGSPTAKAAVSLNEWYPELVSIPSILIPWQLYSNYSTPFSLNLYPRSLSGKNSKDSCTRPRRSCRGPPKTEHLSSARPRLSLSSCPW
jgi:hypothetical protein